MGLVLTVLVTCALWGAKALTCDGLMEGATVIFTQQQYNKAQRTNSAIHPRAWFLAMGLIVLSGLTASAECTFSEQGDPPRQIITCTDALTVEKEAATKLQITERAGDAPPRVIQVESGGIFIEVLPDAQPTQIRTPHAIAAVRGYGLRG